jgi:intracellular multiplication protein IcmE
MTLIPATHSRFGRFRSGLLGGAGRGGQLRLIGIVSVILLAIGLVVFASTHSNRLLPQSQVTRMKPGNLLPGGLLSTPQQDAILKTDSQEKAKRADEEHKSFTPSMPGSQPFNGLLPLETGMGQRQDFEPVKTTVETPPAPAIVAEPPPPYTAPQPLAPDPDLAARVQKVAAGDGGEGDAAGAQAQNAHQQRQKAIGDMLNRWNSRAPQTTVILEPAVLKEGLGEAPALTKGVGSVAAPEKMLISAGRGIYAHTILAVDSDTNGPIVLQADTGPIAGDRMIGMFSKSGTDRLIVKVQTVEHRGKTLEANGSWLRPIRWRKRSQLVSTNIISSASSCQPRRHSWRVLGRL